MTSPSPRPLFTVCICTFNRERLLRAAIESVCSQGIDARSWELCIVDNNSSDATRASVAAWMERRPNIRYCFEPTQGLSRARNRGWHEARGVYVGYLDDDALATPGWLATAIEVAGDPAPAAFGGPYLAYFESQKPAWFQDRYLSHTKGDAARALAPTEYLSGGNLFVLRDRLEALGGFREDAGMRGDVLGYGEETDLQRRLRSAFPADLLYYEPRLAIRHLVTRRKLSWSWHLRSAFVDGRSHYHVFERWNEPRWNQRALRAALLLPLDLVRGALWRDRTAFPLAGNYYYERTLQLVRDLGAGFEHLRRPGSPRATG